MTAVRGLGRRLAGAVERWSAALLALAVIALAAQKEFQCNPALDDGLDGSFYYQIARHVSEGHGLVTGVSLYHQALDPLPQRSGVYPLWPLVLGGFGALAGMERAGFFVSRILYLLSLAVLYGLVQRIARRSGWQRPFGARIPLGPGHLALALLALNPVFRWATTRTYTEGLAVLLLLCALLCFDVGLVEQGGDARRRWWLCLAGTLAGCTYATRYQLIGAGPALAIVLFFVPGRGRRGDLLHLLAGYAVPFTLVGLHVAAVPGSTAFNLLRMGVQGRLAGLPVYGDQVPTASFSAYLWDRLGGLLVALDPWSRHSYWFQHGSLAVVPPLALLVLLCRARAVPRIVRAWFEPRHAAMTAAALCAVLVLLSMHTQHFSHWDPWLFGWRHGLPLFLLTFPATAFLASQPLRGARLLALSLVLASLAGVAGREVPGACEPNLARTAARRQIGAWLDGQTPLPTILGIEPQPLAVHSAARIHWVACWSPPELVRTLVDNLSIDYLVTEWGSLSCPSLGPLRHQLTPVLRGGTPGWPFAVFRIGRGPRPARPERGD